MPGALNEVVSVAVPKALPFAFVNAVGTTGTVQEAAVPHAEKVTEPVGPSPLLMVPVIGLNVRTKAVNVTDWLVFTVAVARPFTVTAVCVAVGAIVIAVAAA